MKRLLWLLAVPYVVIELTPCPVIKGQLNVCPGPGSGYDLKLRGSEIIHCEQADKAYCYDLAESLNEAHERRTHCNEKNLFIQADGSHYYAAPSDCDKETK